MKNDDDRSIQYGQMIVPMDDEDESELVPEPAQLRNIKRSQTIICESETVLKFKNDHVLVATGDKSKKQVISYRIRKYE